MGNDVDARPFCVDKLLRLTARGGIEIDGDTTIIVDEAGMLSTRQAHHILQLSERHGAKIVFAGDTQQQQPVEAGPGLRLIRDAVGSVRVDRIRRQKADLEDILVHVHGEAPEAARFRTGMMGEQERTRIVAEYEAMEDKPAFTPWQVAASEALRDGDAASAIAAHRARGRFHIGYDEEKTLTGLVDDWDRYQRANPDKSSVVLARTRAEVRALSHLMRERRFAALPDGERPDMDRVTIIVSRGTEDERTTSPLEIVRGDRLRIGATHWEKQLFNGTVVTVDDFKVQRGEAGTEPSVLISARTEDGRAVSFHHDEIRDWYGNIRLDHGYALTITSAQGLTVDRTFLLADARPARETIYPAATRHREGLDIYVNRAPLALDIADRRADNDREAVVTDTEIRAYLAERWSRSQPKEAALDYMADGVWEDQREHVREDNSRSIRETREEPLEARPAANDNALARIARDIRRTAFGWRHAQAVSTFAAGREEILAAYDDLRERTRMQGDSVALGPAYQETLTRHSILLKQAAAFRARPDDFASLLAQRGGIGRKDLDAFEDLHTRARRHRRAAMMRYVHRIKREAGQGPEQQPGPELRQGELPLEDDHAALDGRAETVERTATTADAGAPAPDAETAKPNWVEPYEALRRDWNNLIERVQQTGEPIFYTKGYADMMSRMQGLADNTDIPAETRAPMIRALENHQRDLSARNFVADYLDAAERHMGNHAALQSAAQSLDIPIAEVQDHPDWRQEADRLVVSGEAILSDKEAYGVHIDHILIGDTRLKWALSDLREAIRRDSASIRENAVTETREHPSPAPTPEESAREAQSRAHEFRRLQSAAYHATGDERIAARKAFDEYRARESKHYTTPVEDRRQARDIHEEAQQQSPSPQTDEERAREAQSRAHEFRRLQSAAYHATGDERIAARKAFDEYRARESKHYTTPVEDRRQARDIHEEAQQQSPSPQKDEERAREAQSRAHEFRRLQSAAYNATGDERIAAQKAFDDYREREFKKNEKHEEKKRQTRKKSRGLRMRLQ